MEKIINQNQQEYVLPIALIGVLFFVFGFVTWLNGSLIPFLQIVCELNEFEALFVTFAFYIAYTVMALPMSMILRWSGYKNGMALGLFIMALGALFHIPAALSASYPLFLTALFMLGTGLTILQTASNPYIVYLGPVKSAAMRISIMGIINKSAGVIVPIAFTALVLADVGGVSSDYLIGLSEAEKSVQLSELSGKLVKPYIMMSAVLFGLILLVKLSVLPDISLDSGADESAGTSKKSILGYPQAVLGAIALFAYVGVEVIAGDTIGLYGSDLGVKNFASLTSYTMVFMVIGYTIGVFCIPKLFSQQTALVASAVAGTLCILGILTSSETSYFISSLLWEWTGFPLLPDPLTLVALMGLAHALVWPSVWPLALNGLGKHTAQGSALLIMGISGGAILPLAFGKISYLYEDIQLAYIVGIPCYLFILFYAVKGHKMRGW